MKRRLAIQGGNDLKRRKALEETQEQWKEPIKVEETSNFIEEKEDRIERPTICRINTIMIADELRVKLKWTLRKQVVDPLPYYTSIYGNGPRVPIFGTDPPAGFTLWANFYERYVVTGSKLKCKIIDLSSTINGIDVVIVPTTIPFSTIEDAAEQKYAVRDVWRRNQNKLITYESYMSTAKMWGKSKKQIREEDNFSAQTSTNPANVWHWSIVVGGISGDTDTPDLFLYFEVIYYVTFFKKRALT